MMASEKDILRLMPIAVMAMVLAVPAAAQIDVNLSGDVVLLDGATSNSLVLSHYDPAIGRTVVDVERPILCLSSSEAVPTGQQSVLLDGNALPGVGQRDIGALLLLDEARYVTTPGVGTSFDITIAGNGFGTAVCYQSPVSVPTALPNDPPLCSGSLTKGPVAQEAIFNSDFDGSNLRVSRRFVVEGGWLNYRIDVQLVPGTTRPTRFRAREWFPTNSSRYQRVLGTEIGTGVVEASCTGWNQASCDGEPSRNYLATSSNVIALWNSYLPASSSEGEEPACVSLRGKRKLESGDSQMPAAPYGFGLTEFGSGSSEMVGWFQLPTTF